MSPVREHRLATAFLAALPAGKAQWVGAIIVIAGAAAGAIAAVSDGASNITLIPELRIQVTQNTGRINVLEDSVNAGSRQRRRILCLSEISASGEIVPVFELNRRCP